MTYTPLKSRKHETHIRNDHRTHPTFTVDCSCGERLGPFDTARKALKAELCHINDRSNAANVEH